MKVISKFKVTKDYEVWRKAFESNEARRLQRGVRVLAYGHENGNENSVYTVVEMNSVEDKRLEDPVMIKSREEAGVDHTSLEITPLVE